MVDLTCLDLVRQKIAREYSMNNRVFIAGDACAFQYFLMFTVLMLDS